ncbi:MAG: dihydrolipoyl dehydrogenase [Chloroflexi bacterium]|nr:dihydrolipoyl dehydrogenase [Chloroflexota bacterium]
MEEGMEYDIAIVGGGPGGYVAAIRAAQLGAKVALVEKERLGGTCLNRGCIPTKALARSAEAFHEVKVAQDFGVETSTVAINFPQIIARKNSVVNALVGSIEQLMRAGGIKVYDGLGRLTSPRTIKVDEEEVKAKRIILATGSVPARIPVPGLDLPGVVTSNEILDIAEFPSSLVIIGGGIIGVEFASIFGVLGSKVAIVEMLPQIMPPVDDEISRRFGQVLRSQGVEVHTGAAVKMVQGESPNLEVVFDTAKGEKTVTGEMVLVAVGRSPYTEGLGLAEIGMKMNRRAVAVNEYLETNIPGVYAIGDAIGGIMLAHVASYEGEIAVANALGGEQRVDYRVVPNGIFTYPEIAGVGMMEKEVRDAEIPYKISRFPFSALGRAQVMGETTGTVKLICNAETGKVLGMHIMGPHATDLVQEGALAMQLGATAEDISHTIHSHPTLPEAIMEAALGQGLGSIHLRKI